MTTKMTNQNEPEKSDDTPDEKSHQYQKRRKNTKSG